MTWFVLFEGLRFCFSGLATASKRAGGFCDFGGRRLLRIKLGFCGGTLSVRSCYAPTFRSSEQEKETFYEKSRQYG